MQKKQSRLSVFTNGLVKENPLLVLSIGFVFFACRYDERVQRHRYGIFDDVRSRYERINNRDFS